jgi:hypothetical protein
VRVLDIGSKPKLLKRVGFCREDRFDSAVFGLWLGTRTIVEETYISPSPHGEAYQLWSGPPGGTLHQIGSDWGWTDSDEPPTYGCDRMVAAGGGVVAVTPVANDLGEGTSCTSHTSTEVILKGALDRKVTVAGSWGAIATNGKRVALVGFDASGKRTGTLAMIDIAGHPLGVPRFTAQDVKSAFQGWLTPVGLFLLTRRGIVGPGSRLLVRGYSSTAIAEGRAVYTAGRNLRARRLKGGPDRLLLKLPDPDSELAAGSFGIAVMTGAISGHMAVYRIPWRTIDQTVPR